MTRLVKKWLNVSEKNGRSGIDLGGSIQISLMSSQSKDYAT